MFEMVGPSSFFAEDWDTYGKHDKICPFKTTRHLVNALEDNNVDYKYFEASHSGHGLQNDSKVYEEFMNTVVSYLDKYMPVEK